MADSIDAEQEPFFRHLKPQEVASAMGIGRERRPAHSPILKGGHPIDLQPIPTIDPLRWQGRPVPEREWLVRDIVPMDNVTLLNGHGGTGKSILTLQLLVCASLGLPWLGFETRPVKALGFFAEDDAAELHRRLAAILKHYDRDFGDLEGLTLLDRVDQPNWLMEWGAKWEAGNETALYYQLAKLLKYCGAQLLVIDSLYNVFTGSKLEERHAWEFVSVLRRLALQMKGAVLLTFHPSQSGMNTGTGEFGSVGWHNACRSRLYLTAPKIDDGEQSDHNFRELRAMKANYAGRSDPIKLRWADGAFERIEEATGIIASIQRHAAERAFLAALDAVAAQGRTVSDAPTSQRYAPKLLVKMPQASGYTTRDFQNAMLALFSANRIKVAEVGKMANRTPMLGIVRTADPVHEDSDE